MQCAADELMRPINLGHIFETDVRAFRFATQIAAPEPGDRDAAEFRARFVRTLGEALRMSAAKVLDADPRDLAATMQLDTNRPVAVLYDTVPGGAGYVRRLGEGGAMSMSRILRKTVELLDCPAGCTSTCRNCLSDYSNQVYWDQLDRIPVLAWLQSMLLTQTGAGDRRHGATLWANSSLAALGKRLSGAAQVVFFAGSIAGSEDSGAAWSTAKFIRDLCESDPKRKIYVASAGRLPVTLSDLSTADLEAAETLAKLEKEGKLSFFRLPDAAVEKSLPRVFANGSDGRLALWPAETNGPLLGKLLDGQQFIAPDLEDESTAEILNFLSDGQPVANSLTSIIGNVRVWDFPSGKTADLRSSFAPILEHRIRMEIDDPYLLKDRRARKALLSFLKSLREDGTTFEYLSLTWRENHPNDPGDPWSIQQSEMQELLHGADFDLNLLNFNCRPFRERRGFHDRTIKARLTDTGNSDRVYQWDLSSGIGNLMDPQFEAKVYLRTE